MERLPRLGCRADRQISEVGLIGCAAVKARMPAGGDCRSRGSQRRFRLPRYFTVAWHIVTAAPTAAAVMSGKGRCEHNESDSPLIADMERASRHVANGPISDIHRTAACALLAARHELRWPAVSPLIHDGMNAPFPELCQSLLRIASRRALREAETRRAETDREKDDRPKELTGERDRIPLASEIGRKKVSPAIFNSLAKN